MNVLLKKLLGTKNERTIKKWRPLVVRVADLEPTFQAKSDDELRAMTGTFRERIGNGEPLDSVLPESFACVREASVRTLGMRHYDVQVVGAIALHRGMISEMKTGEGKTLVATMPLYLNALSGRGAHLVTVNDYLARRDAEWMGRIYGFLGMNVGVIVHGLTDGQRQDAYGSDITYGQNNEFGFDYLRDNMKFRLQDYVQRELNFAIVDEVDSILIDEARTPLIISGPAEGSSKLYYRINAIIPFLKADEDYVNDEKSMSVSLTDAGVDKVARRLGMAKPEDLFDPENIELLHHVNTGLRAHALFKRDQHYLVEGGEIIIVDEFTGRKMPGRRWSDGLHQAVEAKEGLKVQEENQTLATITFQNYFRMYDKLAGMTGTADTEAEEFHKIYKLDVLVIPTNRPIIRDDHDDWIYTTERGKFRAIAADIKESHEKGQPVLVGTTSVEKNEFLSKLLRREGVPHEVLNAKNHANEAIIVAQAGRKGTVTIATNMAGRGTDIILGGNPEYTAAQMAGVNEGPEYEAALEGAHELCAAGREEVLAAGGLRVVGTERHESRRIDNQLRGRAGRQGDPGSTRFYLSLEDDLLRIFGGENVKKWMDRLKVPEDEPIFHKWVNKVIASSQRKVEARNFDIRKGLLEYDDVMNQQRSTIYGLRRQTLEGGTTHDWIKDAVADVAYMAANRHCPEDALAEDWDMETLVESAKSEWTLDLDLDDVDTGSFDEIAAHLSSSLQAHYEARAHKIADQLYLLHEDEEGATPEHYWDRWLEYEREQLLRQVDRNWRMHLQGVDHLREGIHLEAYGQRDPKLIYKKAAFEYFQNLLETIKEGVTGTLFRVVVRDDAQIERLKREREEAARKLMEQQQEMHAQAEQLVGAGGVQVGDRVRVGAPQGRPGAPVQGRPPVPTGPMIPIKRRAPKVGRNDPCPCGSGRKYKKCCMLQDSAGAPA
jgi:preprotein translocase subunit SecA